jgi:hypothetical protein
LAGARLLCFLPSPIRSNQPRYVAESVGCPCRSETSALRRRHVCPCAHSMGIVYDQPLLLATRQSGAAIEGAVRQAVTGIERVAVDTHGCTDFALACAKLLGFDLCPRLRSMRDRKPHLPPGLSAPASIAPLQVSAHRPVASAVALLVN